jgi:hypothetical protein
MLTHFSLTMAIVLRVGGDHHHHHDHHHRISDNTRLYHRATAAAIVRMVAWLAVIHHGYSGGCVVMAAFENLPTSPQRQALVQKARELNPTFSSSTATWSNRAGTVLTPICLDTSNSSPNGVGGVYSADRPFLWNSIDVGGRMAVIALPSTNDNSNKPDLWVHSPVALDGPLRDAMAQIGNVKHVVSPNYEHVKYASTWNQGYPQASMWACPGLASRMENVKWKGEMPEGMRPSGWKGPNGSSNVRSLPEGFWDTSILQALHVNIEKNPFTGKPFFSTCIVVAGSFLFLYFIMPLWR